MERDASVFDTTEVALRLKPLEVADSDTWVALWTALRLEVRLAGTVAFVELLRGRDATAVLRILERMPDIDRKCTRDGNVLLEIDAHRASLIMRAMEALASTKRRRSAFCRVEVVSISNRSARVLHGRELRKAHAELRRHCSVDPRRMAVVAWDNDSRRAVVVDRGSERAFALFAATKEGASLIST